MLLLTGAKPPMFNDWWPATRHFPRRPAGLRKSAHFSRIPCHRSAEPVPAIQQITGWCLSFIQVSHPVIFFKFKKGGFQFVSQSFNRKYLEHI
jgi:hypothetical protein